MITIALFLASFAGQQFAAPVSRPTIAPQAAYCHQQMVCGIGGCQWIWICN
jgi:hypothetical protein